jgi:hypothetical protein
VNGITTADPAAVVDCWGCPDVGADLGADAAAEVVAVAPDAGAADAAGVAGVVADPEPDAPVLVQAALPAVTRTIATVKAILVN